MPISKFKTVYSITGTHSVGKSTLLEVLRVRYGDSISFLDEPARQLIECGYAMNNEITEHGLMMYISHFLRQIREAPHTIVVCDRSVLDLVAYTTATLLLQLSSEAGVLSREVLRLERQFIAAYIFVPIEFPMVSDNVRPSDEAYRVLVQERIQQIFREEQLPFVRVTGSVEARVSQIVALIDKCLLDA